MQRAPERAGPDVDRVKAPPATARPRTRISLLILIAGLIAGALLSLVLGPFPPRLGPESGEHALAEEVRGHLGD